MFVISFIKIPPFHSGNVKNGRRDWQTDNPTAKASGACRWRRHKDKAAYRSDFRDSLNTHTTAVWRILPRDRTHRSTMRDIMLPGADTRRRQGRLRHRQSDNGALNEN